MKITINHVHSGNVEVNLKEEPEAATEQDTANGEATTLRYRPPVQSEKNESDKLISVCYNQMLFLGAFLIFILYDDKLISAIEHLLSVNVSNVGFVGGAITSFVWTLFFTFAAYFFYHFYSAIDKLKLSNNETNRNENAKAYYAFFMSALNISAMILTAMIFTRVLRSIQESIGVFFIVLSALLILVLILVIVPLFLFLHIKSSMIMPFITRHIKSSAGIFACMFIIVAVFASIPFICQGIQQNNKNPKEMTDSLCIRDKESIPVSKDSLRQ